MVKGKSLCIVMAVCVLCSVCLAGGVSAETYDIWYNGAQPNDWVVQKTIRGDYVAWDVANALDGEWDTTMEII